MRVETIDAAWQVIQDGHQGSIETGKIADFAILNRNPLQAPADQLSVQVVKTLRHGKLACARDGRQL
ncbi:MAG: putative amidohydrolase YtcJ [Gammaproteobacteria bacterium]